MVDTRASEARGGIPVEVRVLFSAPNQKKRDPKIPFLFRENPGLGFGDFSVFQGDFFSPA
jgi:hypothetical protein